LDHSKILSLEPVVEKLRCDGERYGDASIIVNRYSALACAHLGSAGV